MCCAATSAAVHPAVSRLTDLHAAVASPREPAVVFQDEQSGQTGVILESQFETRRSASSAVLRVVGVIPPVYPEWLGDRGFLEVHQVRFAYIAGAMANGIASPEMVASMANAGMLAFLGCAGLSFEHTQQLISQVRRQLRNPQAVWGANLIHSPAEPELEERLVDLFLTEGIRHVSASAFLSLRPSVVRYACRGLSRRPDGSIRRAQHVFAKVSRGEVASAFMSPPPQALLEQLQRDGQLTEEEVQLAAHLPIAEDITAEADSGGHTDNRPLTVLFSELATIREQLTRQFQYERPPRLGAAGGLGTPRAVAAAFALGADYVLTGSVNQASVEAGVSEAAKRLLATTGMADVTMAPAADMFEMGVKLQVLRRGSLFAARAQRLYDLYREYSAIEQLPTEVLDELETQIFRRSIDDVWSETVEFWQRREPAEVTRAAADPQHRMALIFRWYLGLSSRWAIQGDPQRTIDYQLWCGPAMGSFNSWVQDSYLEPLQNRHVVQIALNLLEGASIVSRAQQFRSVGVDVPDSAFNFRPRRLQLSE